MRVVCLLDLMFRGLTTFTRRRILMLKSSCFLLFLGAIFITLAIRAEFALGARSDLRTVNPGEAELLKGAVCPLVGVMQKKVCASSGVTPSCGVLTPAPCGAFQCALSCWQWQTQKAAGCDATVGPCSTIICLPANSVVANCPTRTNTQKTCGGALWCGCGAPSTTVNCPTLQTYTKWLSCP